jgi:hypothetical protein
MSPPIYKQKNPQITQMTQIEEKSPQIWQIRQIEEKKSAEAADKFS